MWLRTLLHISIAALALAAAQSPIANAQDGLQLGATEKQVRDFARLRALRVETLGSGAAWLALGAYTSDSPIGVAAFQVVLCRGRTASYTTFLDGGAAGLIRHLEAEIKLRGQPETAARLFTPDDLDGVLTEQQRAERLRQPLRLESTVHTLEFSWRAGGTRLILEYELRHTVPTSPTGRGGDLCETACRGV